MDKPRFKGVKDNKGRNQPMKALEIMGQSNMSKDLSKGKPLPEKFQGTKRGDKIERLTKKIDQVVHSSSKERARGK